LRCEREEAREHQRRAYGMREIFVFTGFAPLAGSAAGRGDCGAGRHRPSRTSGSSVRASPEDVSTAAGGHGSPLMQRRCPHLPPGKERKKGNSRRSTWRRAAALDAVGKPKAGARAGPSSPVARYSAGSDAGMEGSPARASRCAADLIVARRRSRLSRAGARGYVLLRTSRDRRAKGRPWRLRHRALRARRLGLGGGRAVGGIFASASRIGR